MLKTKTTWTCICYDCLGFNSIKTYISTQGCLHKNKYDRLEHLNALGKSHHGRLVHKLSLPKFNYLLDAVLPFPDIYAYDIH